MAYKTWSHNWKDITNFCEVRFVEDHFYLQVRFFWALCTRQEDHGEFWHYSLPHHGNIWFCPYRYLETYKDSFSKRQALVCDFCWWLLNEVCEIIQWDIKVIFLIYSSRGRPMLKIKLERKLIGSNQIMIKNMNKDIYIYKEIVQHFTIRDPL